MGEYTFLILLLESGSSRKQARSNQLAYRRAYQPIVQVSGDRLTQLQFLIVLPDR